MRMRLLVLSLLLAGLLPAVGCGWRTRAYRYPAPPCNSTAVLLPATTVPVACPCPCP